MEHIIKQIKKGAKQTRLSALEKAEMKRVLVSHVKAHPAVPGSIPSPFSLASLRNKKSISVLVIGGLLMGSSVSFAAEGTLPGDALYPVKLHVNEVVRGAMAVTPKAKAEWDVYLVERRLQEVEKLASMPHVLSNVQETAQGNLERYASRVKEHISRFEEAEDEEDALTVAEELSNVLRSHEGTLEELKAHGEVVISRMVSDTASVGSNTKDVNRQVEMDEAKEQGALESIITQLRADREEVEHKHEELKHKYRRDKGVEADSGAREYRVEEQGNEQKDVVSVNAEAAGVVATSVPPVEVLATPFPHKEETNTTTTHEEIRATPEALLSSDKKVELHDESSKKEDSQSGSKDEDRR